MRKGLVGLVRLVGLVGLVGRVGLVRRVGLVLMALLVLAPSASGEQRPSTAALEAEVRDFEQKYNGAYAANDLPTYFGYLAPDFAQWLPSGRTDKAAYEASWTKFIKGGGKVLSAEIAELQIKIGPSGDTAVASYLLRVKTQSARGTSDDIYQETDVLFKRDGAWKVVYLHYSPAPQK